MEQFVEGEIEEMVELYVGKGVPVENARRIMTILSKNPKVFVDVMMAEELGIASDTMNQIPWKHGFRSEKPLPDSKSKEK